MFALAAAVLLAASQAPSNAVEPRPNVVFFLVDDLGWADIGCFGSSFYKTPNVDRLAGSGVKFTQAYAACPVCSPTRASIMTGRHPVRVDITDWIPGASRSKAQGAKLQHVDDRDDLALEEVTMAEVFGDAGYRTYFAGKWHLGAGPGDRMYKGGQTHLPTDQGFDLNVGGGERGSPYGGYYAPWSNPRLKTGNEGEYLTNYLTDRTVEFIKTHQNSSAEPSPFFVYLSYYNVHTPIQAYKPRLAEYEAEAAALDGDTPVIDEHTAKSRGRQDYPAYASMVSAMDESVGRVLDSLEAAGVADNTIVCFFSDNGGLCTTKKIGPTCNLPLRSGKGWLYEGGVREPMIIRAPGVAKAGSTCETPVVSMDFAPTLSELCGIEATPDLHADGHSLVTELKGDAADGDRALYWHYPHYHGSTWTPGASIRDGDWKLIEFYHDEKVELYNLADDLGEQHDLSTLRPEMTEKLLAKLHTWQGQMNAKMPQPFEN